MTLWVVVFRVADRRFGIAADAVERVIRSCEVAPLPSAPDVVAGIVNMHGTVVPVLDTLRRFDGRATQLHLGHRFIVVRTPAGPVILIADEIIGTEHVPDEMIAKLDAVVPGAGTLLEGVLPSMEGLIYVQAAELLFSNAEQTAVNHALAKHT